MTTKSTMQKIEARIKNWSRNARGFFQTRGSMLLYLSVLGPGIIAGNAGNDAGGIATYASVGADYSYSFF